MKKVYEKPMISIETLSLDMPVALDCVADFDDMNALMEFGYFNPEYECSFNTDSVDWEGEDTICYHSNVIQAFLS